MFSYLSSAKNIDQENDAEVRKMLSSQEFEPNLIEKPVIFDKTRRSQPTELTTNANSPSNGDIKFMTTETPNQRILEFHLQIRGNCFEDKLFVYFTEMMNQTCNDYLIEHLFLYSRKDYSKLTQPEKLKHFVNLLQGIDKTTYQRYESNSIHRSSYVHAIHKDLVFQGFKRIDEIVNQSFSDIFPKERLQDYKVYALRIARSSTKGSIVLSADWEITAFTNNLEELEIEYKKQFNLLRGDPSKHIEIIGLFSEAGVCQFNGKQPDPELAPSFEKLKILESGTRNVTSDSLKFKIPRHVVFQYSLTPSQSKIICYNLVEDLAFKMIKALKGFFSWSTQRDTIYKIIFSDENYTYVDRSKPSNARSLENNFINELNRCKDHKRLRAEDLLLTKNKALLASEKLVIEKTQTDMGGANLNFTQSVTEILTNFGVPKNYDKLMSSDTIINKLKQLQLGNIRKYILDFIKQKGDEKVPEGEDEIAYRGKYFLQWAEALHARELLLSKMKVLMKINTTATPAESKKLLNAVLKSSETLLADKTPLFILPCVQQILFQQPKFGHEIDFRNAPIMDRIKDEEAKESKYVKYRKAEIRRLTEKLLENPAFKDYSFILSNDEEESSPSKKSSVDLTKWSSTSLNGLSSRKFSTISDNEDTQKENYEMVSEFARKTDRSVIYILVVLFKFFPRPQETEITISIEWNTTASDKTTKLSMIGKEKTAISSLFDLNTFIYDYQLSALLPFLTPSPNEQIFIDIPQAVLNIHSSYTEPPSGSNLIMRNFQFVSDTGLLYFNITGENILEHIYEYSEFYGVSSYKNRHFPSMFFAYQATKKLFASEGKNTRVVFLYSKDGFNEKLNQNGKEMLTSQMLSPGMANKMHLACFIIGDRAFLTDEKILTLQNTLKSTIKDVVDKANEHILAEGSFRRIDILEERDIRKSDLHILISHSACYSLKEKDMEFMKAVSSLSIFGAEFQDFLKSCYRGAYMKVKVITDPLADERELITSVLIYKGNQHPLLLLEINRSEEIQNIYLVKVFSVVKSLSVKEERELIKQFKRDIVFQWICLQNNFLHFRD